MELNFDGVPIRPFSEILEELIQRYTQGNKAAFVKEINDNCKDIVEDGKPPFSPSLLQKYLTGSQPRLDKLRLISHALQIPITYLAGIPGEGLRWYIRYYPDLWSTNLDGVFRKARKRIDLLWTHADFLVEYIRNSQTGRQEEKRYIDVLIESLEATEDLKVRVLLLDPESGFAQSRESMASAYRLGNLDFRNRQSDLWEGIDELNKCVKKGNNVDPKRFQVKLYNHLPTRIMTRIDGWTYYTPLTHNRGSRNCTTFKVHYHMSNARETFDDHFYFIWHNSRILAY